ncbi:MAG: alpha-glucan family phosphorylase [Streptosporangiaceae bacterium]
MKAIRRFTVRTLLPEPLAPLGELVTNLRWTWHPDTQDLFASVDPDTWQAVGHDPLRLLGAVSTDRLSDLAHDRRFLRRLGDAADELRDYLTGDRWYQSLAGAPQAIAYFSPEYGITAALPQYSGGLGILAGDHLKSASDLGIPIIGVGLLYRHGYFAQSLSYEGWQLERYPPIDPNGLPLALLREEDGSPVRIVINLPQGRVVRAQVWQAQVGRIPLLLLDSDVEDNDPAARDVTDRLYGGGSDHRLEQELLLGVGGVRAVRGYCRLAAAATPEVFHTNEGHAGFLGVERIRELMAEGLAFDEALEAARSGTVFTTHTPVPAGIDRFPRWLIDAHFGEGQACPGVPVERILGLGAETYEGGDPEVFNMAVMGLRLAQRAGGVSALHGEVTREMFAGLWPGFDADEVPVGQVTNGVHAPTWVAGEVVEIGRREGAREVVDHGRDWESIERVPAEAIWRTRRELREKLVREVRRRLRVSWRQRGASQAELGWVDHVFDPDVLTIGFARRVPSYKRLTLMLRDPERLTKLLTHPERPIQILVAGKAHPADEGGKRLIQEIVRFADSPEVRHRVVFLPDYDMDLARLLVQGCDVWLNNPLRPLEACGTSGMKAALNGCLNLSVRDGWWAEWYDGDNGWAIPTAEGVDDSERRDDLEAAALYDLVEHHVSARFYDLDARGLPARWIEMVRHTLRSLGPKVLATRMLREYVQAFYAPAARSTRLLSADGYAAARELAAWKHKAVKGWPGVHVEHVESSGVGETPQLGSAFTVVAVVALGELAPGDVDVQVAYGPVDNADELASPSYVSLDVAERYPDGRVRYAGEVSLDRTGAFGYSVRVLPRNGLLECPAEMGLIAVPDAPRGMTNGNFR